MTAVVAKDLRCRYGDTVALDGVSLTLETGKVFALVGPNGAGKTTLVRALTGTTTVEGTVSVFGEDPQTVDPQRIGVLPQSFSPHARLSARELLEYYAGLYDDARSVDAVLEDVGLVDAADTWYEDLSGGQQRRTCVGATLVNEPDLLVLDEPTTGIGPAGRRSLWNLLDGLADHGVTILLTTHSMEEASRLADRVGLLANGSLVACDPPETLIEAHGGDPRLTVSGSFDEDVIESLSMPAALGPESLTVHGVSPTDIGAVVEELDAAGVTYDGISWAEPDLEDVYMALAEDVDPAVTGGRQREGSAGPRSIPGQGDGEQAPTEDRS